ncbi:unnamed protein product [Adineta steineri]|uniref:B30.2/SPRY domain-containing protein n=1 Tax=Adineta steineri TaxID=433720 RepID=A0A814XI64_9BILA|nr:unnamed protein product [Adineta steineri]
MTTLTTTEIGCSILCTNEKNTSVFTCNGCSQEFCTKQQLSKLIIEHDQLQESNESCHYSSTGIIDKWEHESVAKIHQIADDIRKELKSKSEKHKNQFSKQWEELSEEFKKIHNSNVCLEIDFRQLSNKFNKLKSYLEAPPTIRFQDNILISKPNICTMPDDIFEMFAGDLEIKDNGQVIKHGSTIVHAVVRGSGEYSSGEHRFQFKIESYNMNKWIFFGIISHKVTMRSNTWAIPSCYGWGGQDSTILNLAMHAGLNGYSCDFELNDTIELILDCDHQQIRLTNLRTKRTHMMNINLLKCPFPWHFLLNIFYPNDQVRILYTDSQEI